VAHDLRTPIAVIGLAAQTVERDAAALGDIARAAAEMLGRQADRASQLIDGFLELARASGTPKLEPIDLEALLDESAGEVDGIVLDVRRPLPAIVADRAALRQAFARLFDNASRYARSDGAASVTVSCDESGDGWTIAVADRGPGLPDGVTERPFEPFTRSAPRASGDGSGLGLSIVAAVALAHGGRAWYEHRDGGGSVFKLLLGRATPGRESRAPARS
jgi:signal transduction histidine kinase